MRILKGWTKKEQKELEEAKDGGFNNAIVLINGIADDDDSCTSLTGKYMDENSDEDNQLARDIADYYAGAAKFPDKKYYVHLIKSDEYSYLNINSEEGAELGTKFGFGHWKTKFTREEIIAIDPRLGSFMEEVEDDE